MNEKVFYKLRLAEWQAIQNRAKNLWVKNSLGAKPEFNEIRKSLPNQHSITALEWVAMFVLVVLTVFTSYKVGALAVPFAEHTLETLTDHTYLADWVKVSFTVVTAILFMLLATPSVIYFKLLSHEPEIAVEKKETQHTNWMLRWTLDYITPRLPSLIVYISVGWLIYISSSLPGTPFEQYLPVVVEVGLAALVGNILKKRQAFNKVVSDALAERVAPYEKRLANYETDSVYLRYLYQVMREDLAKVKRAEPGSNRETKVNAWIEDAEDGLVYRVITDEYRRLTAGNSFADQILHGKPETPAGIEQPEIRTILRTPPAGMSEWTPEALAHDLKVRGLDPARGYSEGQLQNDYDKAYKPRSAWRGGARELFFKG